MKIRIVEAYIKIPVDIDRVRFNDKWDPSDPMSTRYCLLDDEGNPHQAFRSDQMEVKIELEPEDE